MTAAPRFSSLLQTEDFPDAMPPVRPITYGILERFGFGWKFKDGEYVFDKSRQDKQNEQKSTALSNFTPTVKCIYTET